MTESKLKQTKNSFKVVGRVTRIDKDGAYKEETMTKGAKIGETYRSLRFGVKTSDSNEITVQMFDFEPTEVFLWNSDKKKADDNYKGEKMPFGQWEQQQEHLREQGYAVLQTRVGLEYGEDGKLQSHGLPSFVASQEIYHSINNGDFVAIEGEIRYSMYKNREDKEIEQKQYNIKKLFKVKPVDFEAETFEEITYFEQEMVFIGGDIDKKEGKMYVTGRHINYNKSFHDTQMIIKFKDDEGNVIPDMVKLVEAISKKVKFGDLISVYGDTLNRVIIEEVEDEGEKNDPFAEFGGKKKPKHAQSFTAKTYITEMQIHGVDAHTEGVYTEEDFEVKQEENSVADEFGGKKKKNNPFANDEGSAIDISDDDLPF